MIKDKIYYAKLYYLKKNEKNKFQILNGRDIQQ